MPALYLDHGIADPGARIGVRASGDGPARATLVRLRGLAGNAVPTGYVEEPIGPAFEATLARRAVPMGSYAVAERGPSAAAGVAWSWTLRLCPTLTDAGEPLAWGHDGPRLTLSDTALIAHWRGAATSPVSIDRAHWSEVRLAYDPRARSLVLTVTPVGPGGWWRAPGRAACEASPAAIQGPLTFARGVSGKLEAPALTIDGAVAARWDLAAAMSTQHIPGEGPSATPLALVNAPRRAVTSSAWDGTRHDWTTAPGHYGAVHFHDTDLADCGWPLDGELIVPEHAASGIYAVRLETAEGFRHAPIYVRARRPARLAFLASTFSYLAYGNSVWTSLTGGEVPAHLAEEAGAARSFGLSTYCRHRDGSGIGLVSSRRPILSTTPNFLGEVIGGQVLFNDDLRILAWLDRVGEPYDIVTDHDLHAQGGAALDPYTALVTGVHPEYHTDASLDAIEGFIGRGGRLIYMGANGFYWRVGLLPGAEHVMEVRRAEGGIRTWAEPAGEYHHQSDGRLGGLWRRLGRPPNRIVGVGFSAQGNEAESRPYTPTEAARDPRAAFLFDGVTEPVLGASGPLGAAAGYELDRADTALGTPPHALVVARADGFGALTVPVHEERLTGELHEVADPLRADLTFFEGPNGGAVLSAGSILFAGSLGEEAGAGRLMTNALQRFVRAEPFRIPGVNTPA